MFNGTLAVHTGYDRDLREIRGADVFTATIPPAKDYEEAAMLRLPVSSDRPKSAAVKAVDALADELPARLASRRSGGAPASTEETA